MSVLLYTAPIFAALGLHMSLPEERSRLLQPLGVFVAFGGIAIVFLDHSSPCAESNVLLSSALAPGGGLA